MLRIGLSIPQKELNFKMNNKKNSIYIISSLGFGIRNFFIGRFIDFLEKNCNIYFSTYLYDNPYFLEIARKKGIKPIPIFELNFDNKWRKIKSLREGLHVAYLNNETWKLKQSDKHHQMNKIQKIKNKIIMAILKTLTSPYTIKLFDKLETKMALKSPTAGFYFKLFEEIKPKLVFSTCPLMPVEWVPIQVAKSMGIKTALYILSWDNLSTKQRPPLPVDLIFVWNERMKRELEINYPGSEKAEIFISGSTQFDFYFNTDYFESKEEFFKRKGIEIDKPLIVYAGVTPSLMPEENLIVERLIEDIKLGKVINNPQLLVRLHPKDDGSRYKILREKYKDILFSIPGEKNEGKIQRWLPNQEEIKELVSIVKYCDVNINVASTMTIDSALMDKPVINVKYYLSKNRSKAPWGIYIYETTHYKPIVETKGAEIASSPEELVEKINYYLIHPEKDKEGRKKIVEMVCGKVDGKAYEKIALKLLEYINNVRDL